MSTASSMGLPIPLQPQVRPRAARRSDELMLLFRSRLGYYFKDGGVITSSSARVLKKRLSHRVVSYKLTLENDQTGKQSFVRLIGKKYSERAAGKAAREFEALQTLWEAGFGQDQQFQIPKPVHLFPDLKLFLQEKADGSKLCSYLGQNSQSSLAHARMAGLWLAKLHSLEPKPAGVCSYEDELSALSGFVKELSTAHDSLTPQLQAVEATIRQKLKPFQGVPVAMIHGDFHPENIFVTKGRVTVIDFDRFSFGDPAKDLGCFTAHMRTRACFSGKSLEAVNHEITAFLKGYFSTMSLAQGAALASRIVPFVALFCLEALHYWHTLRGLKDTELLDILLRCTEGSGIPKVERSPSFEAPAA